MMTGQGTNTYLVGERDVAVIDPGPAMQAHVDSIIEHAGGRIAWILVTHTHPDHSPAASLLADRTGAEQLGMPAPDGPHQDHTFRPDRVLTGGDTLQTGEFALRAVHTPGHASNHVCFLHQGRNWLFTGDHLINGSTVVIDPPDGNMLQYIESLRQVKALRCDALAPGHGDLIDDPDELLDWTVAHRLEREEKVRAAMEAHADRTTHELVPLVYKDVDPKLYGWAERSLLAHALKLEAEGKASSTLGRWRLRE